MTRVLLAVEPELGDPGAAESDGPREGLGAGGASRAVDGARAGPRRRQAGELANLGSDPAVVGGEQSLQLVSEGLVLLRELRSPVLGLLGLALAGVEEIFFEEPELDRLKGETLFGLEGGLALNV